MLSVANKPFMLSVFMLSVIMLNVVMLNGVAQFFIDGVTKQFGHVSSVPGKSMGGAHKTSDNNLTIISKVRVS
jgi:hypothetical protein